jgi:hypothetical protein
MPSAIDPAILYTIIPAGTVPVKGEVLVKLTRATLGVRKPLFVLSSSSREFALIVFGLSPILTCAFAKNVASNMPIVNSFLINIDFECCHITV